MTYHRPTRTIQEISDHNAQRLAEIVARKLLGEPEPQVPFYTGKSIADLVRHRIKAIEATTDIGWGDPQSIRQIKHHTREAVITARHFADRWDVNTERGGPGGWNNLSRHAKKLIQKLRERIDPAIHVSEAEFDPNHILRRRYDAIEAAHQAQIEAIGAKYDALRDGAGSYARKQLRDAERNEIQDVLNSMADAVGQWEEELHQACTLVGLH